MVSALFLFPGQGSQKQGMAIDLYDASVAVRDLFGLASDICGRDMLALLKDGSEDELKRTDIAQPAITLANLASAAMLREKGVQPAICAGHSLGEYAALATAGVISAEDCLRLVTARGAAMQKAADELAKTGAPGMAAVIGLAPADVERLIGEWAAAGLNGLYAANYNSPRQVVVAGTADALSAAEAKFKEAGARRCIRLNVAGPFHSPLVAAAADAFAPVLDSCQFKDPAIAVFSNVSGKQIKSGAEARSLALRQITESVRWTEQESAMDALLNELNIQAIVEAGPGAVLTGLWKDSGSTRPCLAAGTLASLEETLAVITA